MTSRDACFQAEKERRSLEAQVQRAQKMEALGTLTGGIAHDFNNILTAVLGYTNLALPNVEGTTARHLEQVRQAGERATKLVRQRLHLRRLPSANPVAHATFAGQAEDLAPRK